MNMGEAGCLLCPILDCVRCVCAVYMGEAGCQVRAPNRADRLTWYKTIGVAAASIERLSIW